MRSVAPIALLVAGLFALTADAAPAPKAGLPRVLVVSSNRDGNWEIYLVQPGTGETKNLTENKASDTDPQWSPDGQRVAFTDIRGVAGWRLFTMDADGKNAQLRNTTGNSYGNVYPQWSPDGKRLSYGEMVDGVVQVGVIGADGTGAKVITSKDMHLFTRWSPDGLSLCYCRFEKGRPVVLVVSDPDGRNATDVLRGVGAVAAEWKPK